MRGKITNVRKNAREFAKAKMRKALVLLGTATIMGVSSCGAGTQEVNTAVEAREESILGNQSLRESSVVLTPSEDGTRLSAEVVVYEPNESISDPVNIRQVMEEIVQTCQSRADLQACINDEAIERTGQARGTILSDAQVHFQYWSAEREEWIGLGVGRECDISNRVPSLIRATYLPGIESGTRTSSASYRMPSLDRD